METKLFTKQRCKHMVIVMTKATRLFYRKLKARLRQSIANQNSRRFNFKFLSKLLLLPLVFLSTSVNAEEGWWAVVSYSTNSMSRTLNCERDPIAKLVSTPVFLGGASDSPPSETSKGSAEKQFLKYLYDNELKLLNKIAGQSRVSAGSIVVAKSLSKVRDKAKSYGVYTPNRMCSSSGRVQEIIEVEFEFNPELNIGNTAKLNAAIFGSAEEYKKFKTYFESK